LVLPFTNQVAKQVSKKFFFEKRTKKLLFLESRLLRAGALKIKSFLLLFFKKEVLLHCRKFLPRVD